jgi:hypothetical protein
VIRPEFTGLDGPAVGAADTSTWLRSSSPETRLRYKSDCSEPSISKPWVSERGALGNPPPYRGVGSSFLETTNYQQRDYTRTGQARGGGAEQRKRSAAVAPRRRSRRGERRENRERAAAPPLLWGGDRNPQRAPKARVRESDGRSRPSDLPVRWRRLR